MIGLHSTDAERALIGCLIRDESLFTAISHLLDPAEFYFPSHGDAFVAMLDLHELGEPLDLIHVQERIKAKGGMLSAADLAGMAEMAVPSAPLVERYVQQIKATARKREASKILHEAQEKLAHGQDLDLAETIATLTSLNISGNGKRNGAQPVLVCVSEVEREEVQWLWSQRIPRGKLTIFEGDPGVGKSFASLAVATAVTRGAGLPGQKPTEPAGVLILSAEDGLADTIRPRLEDMGADLTRIEVLRGARDPKGHERPVNLTDLAVLERAMEISKPRLTIVDPIIAYMGSTDEWKASQVRGVLGPLAALAEKTGSAVVAVRHLVKSITKAVYRGAGSIDFLAACRSDFVLGENPENPTEYVMAHVKSSLAPKAPSLTYSIANGRFQWGGESNLTAEQVLAAPATGGEASEKQEAEGFLRDVLSEGPIASAEVKRQAREAGIAERTLWRAKTTLAVRATKEGMAGGWKWGLPC